MYTLVLIVNRDVAVYRNYCKQDAQLSQRDRAAGYISFGRKWKTADVTDNILLIL